MVKVFVYLQSKDGCTLHRLINPNIEVAEVADDIEITFQLPEDVKTKEDLFNFLKGYDIFVFHRVLPDLLYNELRENCPNLKLVIDIDDFWYLGSKHVLDTMYKKYKIGEKIQALVEKCDYVTTTTPILRDKIKPFNKNVVIFPNALKPSNDEEKPRQTNRLRLGLIGGSTHVSDMDLLTGIANQLPKDILDKVQFVLCGFDRGFYTQTGEDGKVEKVPMPWENVGWTQIEKIFTDNYKTISPEHKAFLQQFIWQQEFPNLDEAYRRIWTKDIFKYMDCYDEIDVLLVPLLDNEFNRNKSELKMVEASTKHKPVIVSDVYPYKYCAINAIEKGGGLNPDGNCIMVSENKKTRGWVKAIEKIVKNPELLEMIRTNIGKLTEGDYNLTKVAKDRAEFYKKIA